MPLCAQYKVAKLTKYNIWHVQLTASLPSSLQILSQMTPQTITEIDALLGNKPHSKKELRAWRCKSEWQMMFQEDEEDNDIEKHRFCSAVYSTTCMSSATLCFQYVRISILCAVHCIMYEKRRSLNSEKKTKQKQVIYCSLPIVHRLIISTEEQAKAGWSDRSLPSTKTKRCWKIFNCCQLLTLVNQMF